MTIYLYIKMCSHCGLKYFGKTITSDVYKYLGSGTYWQRRFNKHGIDNVITLGYYIFEDQEKATKFALDFSEYHNIVESKEWANLVPENAKGGGSKTGPNPNLRGEGNGMYGKTHSIETREKLRQAKLGTTLSEETKLKMSISRKKRTGNKHSEETKLKMSNIRKGRIRIISDEEHKRRSAGASRGNKNRPTPSEETKSKIGEGQKKFKGLVFWWSCDQLRKVLDVSQKY